MIATEIKKTYKITIEATEEELRHLQFDLEQAPEYGMAEELLKIVPSLIGEPKEEDDE